jgi:hypothetical protein
MNGAYTNVCTKQGALKRILIKEKLGQDVQALEVWSSDDDDDYV